MSSSYRNWYIRYFIFCFQLFASIPVCLQWTSKKLVRHTRDTPKCATQGVQRKWWQQAEKLTNVVWHFNYVTRSAFVVRFYSSLWKSFAFLRTTVKSADPTLSTIHVYRNVMVSPIPMRWKTSTGLIHGSWIIVDDVVFSLHLDDLIWIPFRRHTDIRHNNA